MYAVVDIAGTQVRVAEGDRIQVPRLKAEAGETLSFDRVLLLSQDGRAQVGAPRVEGASVEASVLGHGKDEKILVFRMKRRKGFRHKNGHRQPFTSLQIQKITAAAAEAPQESTAEPASPPEEEQAEASQ